MSSLVLYLTLSPLSFAQGDTLAPGLVATYRDATHTVRQVVATPHFYLAAGESVHPSIAPQFDAEWTGLLSVLETGDYAFQCHCDVEIAGRSARDPVRLVTGKYPIHLRYRRPPGLARLRLEWRSEKFRLEPVASAHFEHRAADRPGPEELRVERGRELVEELGCVQCHSADSPSLLRRRGPNLTGIGARTSERWLVAWLSDPAAFRADATMPAMLDEAGRRDVARYLASVSGKDRFPARRVSATDVDRGKLLFGATGCAACHRKGRTPLEGLGSKSGVGVLAAFLRDPSRFDPGGRMPSMLLTDEEAIQLAAFLAGSRNPAFEKPFDGGDAAHGKALVRSSGCLACHTLENPSPLDNEMMAPRLDALVAGRGCLAPETLGVPRYRLSVEDRSALDAFLRSYRSHPDRATAPVFTFRREIRRLGCIDCHQIDQQLPTGSPAEAAPPLTDIGAKLRTRWIGEVLSNRRRVQTYLELRMPHYDPRATRTLPESFAKASGVEPGDGPPPPTVIDAERARGVELLGMNVKGMACVGCHDWADFKSQGEHGPQLANAAERFRYEWFVRWMRDPVRILSGTSMPAYFRNKPAEEADRVIRTLWAALAMGESMPLPEGLRAPGGVLGSEEKPVAAFEPIVIRWDMPEATPAAIAVGMTGKISYCFDAGEARLRYAWAGGFVDMSGTLYRKTDETRLTPTAQLIGDVFYRAEEFPWRVVSPDRIPSRRFRGYRLVDGYPEFHYLIDGIDVYERILPVKGRTGIVRQLQIARVDAPVWFVVGKERGVTIRSSLGPIQEGRLRVPSGRDVRFELMIVKEEPR